MWTGMKAIITATERAQQARKDAAVRKGLGDGWKALEAAMPRDEYLVFYAEAVEEELRALGLEGDASDWSRLARERHGAEFQKEMKF